MHHIHRAGATTWWALIFLLILATARAATTTITPSVPTNSPAPATPAFAYVITAEQYYDADGNFAADYLASCHVNRYDGQTWQYHISDKNIGGLTPYQNSFNESSVLGTGIYGYWLDVMGNHPEPYDNSVEAHWENEHDNPDDPDEVTGIRWVEASRDVGFNWQSGLISSAYVRFIIGNAAPVFVTSPQSRTVALGTSVNFGATATGFDNLLVWQRRPAGGSAWQDLPFDNTYNYTATPGGWPPGSSMISFTVTSPAMNGDQYRCAAANAAGTTYSSIATLTAQGLLFDGGGRMIEVSYATPQVGSAGYLQFNLRFNPGTYTTTDGQTADDMLDSYAVSPPGAAKQTFPVVYNNGYQGAFRDNRPAGIYAYGVSLHALHPEPFDRSVEAHWENEYDNPDDDTEITGHHWADAYREIGFDWDSIDVASTTVPFYLDVSAPAPTAAPTFSRQPQAQTVVLTGSYVTATYSAAAVSEALADFTWQRRPAGGAWADLPGAFECTISTASNRSTLTVYVRSPGLNGDEYRCVASNAAGSVTSNGAVLNVYTPPLFVSQPANRNGGVNAMINVSFTASASGQPAPAYQWQRLGTGGAWIDLGDGYPYSGADSSTLIYNGYMGSATLIFRCIASNPAGSATSGVALLQPVSPPVFTTQPTYQAVNEGAVANFSVSVDGSPPITYQWKRRNLDGTWTTLTDSLNYTGTTTAALAVWNTTTAMSGQCFVCVATNSGASVESAWGSLIVTPPFGFTLHPKDQSAVLGGTVTFTATAAGNPPPSYYEWQRKISDDGPWQDMGAYGNTLTVSGVVAEMTTYQYRCYASNGAKSAYSNPAKLIIVPRASQTIHFPAIANQPSTRSQFTLTATATSGLPVTYSIVTGPVSLSGNTVTFLNVGEVTLRASQAGNASYLPAPDEERSFSIVSSAEGAPVAYKATQVTSTQFVANWSLVNGATGYQLEVATNESFTNPVVRRFVSGTAYLVNNVSPLAETIVRPSLSSQTYYYRVRAVTPAGTSPNSNVISIGAVSFSQSTPPDSVWLSGVPVSWTRDANNNLVPHYSGLIDEVIPVGTTGGFNYFISDWSYYNPNNSVTFDSYWPLNDWWASDTVDAIDENGNRHSYSTYEWIDGFTFFDDPQWYKFYISAEFNAEPGYAYDVAYSPTDAPTGFDLGAGIQSSGRVSPLPTGGWQLISLTDYYDRAELNHARFYLIRRAQAFASTTLSIGGTTIGIGAAGASAGPIAVPGIGTVSIGTNTTSVTLPDGTVISVDRTTGQVLKTAPGATVGSPIPIGEITVAGVGIKIDSAGGELSIPGGPTVRVNPNGSGTITLPGGAGISVSNTGIVSVNLPPTVDPAIVKAVDLLGKILQINKGVKISVIDVLGVLGQGAGKAVPFPSSGVIQDILIGTGKSGGVFQVGVQIDDAHTFWFTVNLYSAPKIAVDANRDGVIAFDSNDATSTAKPYRFWLNDDIDATVTVTNGDGLAAQLRDIIGDVSHIVTDPMNGVFEVEQDDVLSTGPGQEDWRRNTIPCKRDLEDFARIAVSVPGLTDSLKNGDLYVGLKWTDTVGTPAIKLYKQYDTSGSQSYITDDYLATMQLTEASLLNYRFPDDDRSSPSAHTTVETGELFVIAPGLWFGLTENSPRRSFLFEGCKAGTGQLKLVLLKRQNDTYAELPGDGGGVWLDLKGPKEFIERWSCGDGDRTNIEPLQRVGAKSGTFTAPTQDAEKDYILYVHGYNMQENEKQRWLETTYKRLWHLGYKGRVGGFSWPCAQLPLPYDDSEYHAWQAGARLAELLARPELQGFRVHILAHSQGNVVAGEALRIAGPGSQIARTYIASQAAIPAHNYDAGVAARTDFTPNTPDIYSHYYLDGQNPAQSPILAHTWPSTNPPYLSSTRMVGAATKYVNFWNEDDYALTGNSGGHPGWMINQRLKNLNNDTGYSQTQGFFRNFPPSNIFFQFPNDRFVIFASCGQAWSRALGATQTGGVFGASPSFNLKTSLGYGTEHIYHSAQFRSSMAQRWQYWDRLLIETGVKSPQ